MIIMNVMVTGATGLIGISLVKALVAKGNNIHALCRNEEKAAAIRHPRVTVFIGTLNNKEVITRAMQGCDAVYHLAAYARVWHRRRTHFYEVNVEQTEALFTIAIDSGIKRVVFVSTAGLLGPSKDIVIDESYDKTEGFFTDYESSKYAAEEIVRMKNSTQTAIVIVNPSRLYGPGLLNESNTVTRLLIKYLTGRWHFLPGRGKNIGNYAYIHDVVEGMIMAMEKGRGGERYILGGHNLRYVDLFRKAGDVVGKQYRLFPIPLVLMRVASWIMLWMAKILKTTPAITPSWVMKYNHNWPLSCKKAEEELGYKITPFEEAVKEIISYYKLKI